MSEAIVLGVTLRATYSRSTRSAIRHGIIGRHTSFAAALLQSGTSVAPNGLLCDDSFLPFQARFISGAIWTALFCERLLIVAIPYPAS